MRPNSQDSLIKYISYRDPSLRLGMTSELLCRSPLGVRNPRGLNALAAVTLTQLLNIILGSLMKLILKNEGFGITRDLSFRTPLWGEESLGREYSRNEVSTQV